MSDVGKAWRGSLGVAASGSKTLRSHSIFPSRAKGGFWLVQGMLGNGAADWLLDRARESAERQEEAAGGVNSENLVEMQLDDDLNGAAGAGEENVQVQSQNASDSPHLIESSSTSSPLEHIILPSGHIADVNCVLLLGGEEALCASGSRDRNVNLWGLRESPRGKLMHTLAGRGTISTHRGWVWCLASSGPLLASGSFDSTIRLWDLEAGGAERGLIQCQAAVLCLSCERDTLLAGSHDQKLSIFDTRGESRFRIVIFLKHTPSFIVKDLSVVNDSHVKSVDLALFTCTIVVFVNILN